MIRNILLQLLILVLLMNGAQAVTYYVSKAGNNTTGLSWATAWSDTTTALALVESHVIGGDTVFFGNGTFIGQITPPGGGSVNDRTCYADSGISLDPVEYTGLSHITGAEAVTDWTVYSGNVYKSYLAYTPIANYSAMYCASDNDSLLGWVNSIAEVNTPGEYFHDATTDSVYVYCYNSGNPNTHTILIANHYSPVVVYSNYSYITFIGLEISYGSKVVMIIADQSASKLPDYITVSHCVVHHVTGDGTSQNPSCITTRGGGGNNDTADYAHGDTIRACTLYATRNGSDWYGHNKNICFYSAIGCVVESCYVTGGGIGINFKCDNGSDQPYNIVRYNTVEGSGNGIDLYAHHIKDSIYGNIVKNSPSGTDGWGITLEGGGQDSACIIYNNTLIDVFKPFVVGPYTSTGIEGTGVNRNFFKYNIVDYVASYDLLTYNDDITDTANMVWDSSVYYRGGGAITIDNVGSWGNWQAAGFDVHSTVTNPGLNSSFEPTNIPRWDIPITYGGRTWYGPGAVQTLWGADPDCDLPGKVTNDGRSPSNGATGVTQPITFEWQDVPTAVSYQIQIDNNVAYSSPERNEFVDSSTYTTSGLAPGATFHWRVRAWNACGAGEWSDSWNFTTYCEQITAPEIALPLDGANNQVQPIDLDWSDVTGADLYRVQVDDDLTFSDPEQDQQISTSTYSVSGLEDGTTYFWRVCAHNACGWSDWSDSSSFTTYSFATQTFNVYDLVVVNITDSSATVEWKTTEEATSQVEYGLDDNYGSFSSENPDFQLNHSVVLSNLTQDTDYHFRVICYNAENDLSLSADSIFQTESTISENGSTLTGSSNTEYGAITPTLRVNNYDDNSDNEYYFEVAEDSSFTLIEESSPATSQQDGLTTSWTVTEDLNIGQTYYWRVNLSSLIYSPVYTFVIRPKTYAHPNPFRPDSDPSATFANVPSGGNLVIMSVSGNEVIRRWANHPGGDITWDGTNQAGNRVASQTYLWFVENSDIKGKIIVIR